MERERGRCAFPPTRWRCRSAQRSTVKPSCKAKSPPRGIDRRRKWSNTTRCACALRVHSLISFNGVSSDAAACRGLQVFARVEQALDVMKAFNPNHVRKIDMVLDKYQRHYMVGIQRAFAGQEALFLVAPAGNPCPLCLSCILGLCGSDSGMHDPEEGAAGAHSLAAHQLGQRWHGGASCSCSLCPCPSCRVGATPPTHTAHTSHAMASQTPKSQS